MSPDDFIEHIRNGDYDDADMARILSAIEPRFKLGAVAYRWTINLPDLTLAEDGLTVGECEDIEAATGLLWTHLTLPLLLSSAKRWGGFLTILYQSRCGLSSDEAKAKVRALTALQAAEGISETTVADPPKDSGT